MNPFRATLHTAAIFALGTGLFAGDYDSLMATAKKYWPKPTTAMVVGDQEAQAAKFAKLVESAQKVGITLQTVTVKDANGADRAGGLILRSMPAFVVLIDSDATMGGDNATAKSFIRRLTSQMVPVIATGDASLKVGAALAGGAAGVKDNPAVLSTLGVKK